MAGCTLASDPHAQLLEALREIDADRSGQMALDPFLEIFTQIGIPEESMRCMLGSSACSLIGLDGNEEIDYEKFVDWLSKSSKKTKVLDASCEFAAEASSEILSPTRSFGTWVDRCAQLLETRGEADFVQKKLIAAQVRAHLHDLKRMELQDAPRPESRLDRIRSKISKPRELVFSCEGSTLVQKMIDEGPVLAVDFVEEVLDAMLDALPKLHPRPLVRLNVSKDQGRRLVVVGDTHGQIKDVLLIFLLYGLPTTENAYLFNGDVADRGPHACEIFVLISVFMLSNPKSVMLTRGNHEDENMNMMPADQSGGFYDECLSKYGEGVFMKFVEVFKLLPLAAVVNDEVFVVHGGLPSGPPPSLELIERIEHTRTCCPEPNADSELDRLFIDLMWSDPQEAPGCEVNPRGAGTLWGPDVTNDFLKENKLRWIIRSHELPFDGERGWMEHHLGLVFTVFSASNYCGYEVNWGAVALLTVGEDGRLEQALREHNVQSFDQLADVAAAPQGEEREKKCQEIGLSWTDGRKIAVGKMRVQLALRRLGGIVIELKPELWQAFRERDPTNTGTISRDDWLDCLICVCGGDLPWEEASKCWTSSAEDRVDYRQLLTRFKVVLAKEKWCAWKSLVIADVYEELLSRDVAAQDLLRTFDPSGNGLVTVEDFTMLMKECCGGCLTEPQIAALSRTIFTYSDGRGLRVNDFLSHFALAFVQSKGMVLGKDDSSLAWCQTAINQIGKLILRTHACSNDARSPSKTVSTFNEGVLPLGRVTSVEPEMLTPLPHVKDRSSSAIVKAFQKFDDAGDGFLHVEEFVRHVSALPGFEEIRHDGKPLDEDNVRSIAKAIAACQSDKETINLLQFAQAFMVIDTSSTTDIADDLHEQILTFLYRHRHALRCACTEYDTNFAMRVSGKDFAQALEAVSCCSSKQGKQLTRAQMGALVESITEDDGNVEYEAFLSSFEVQISGLSSA